VTVVHRDPSGRFWLHGYEFSPSVLNKSGRAFPLQAEAIQILLTNVSDTLDVRQTLRFVCFATAALLRLSGSCNKVLIDMFVV
jgi:hypothetical protein